MQQIKYAILLVLCSCLNHLRGQSLSKPQVNFFGHLEYDFDALSTGKNAYFSIGEQDFFITSKITDRLSFLGETVVRTDAKSSSFFIPSVERVQIKYDYFKNHSIVIGKMHTPVNYWNDVYHHGRLFFPTIDRPLAFSYFIPLHSLGVRAQGQNLGTLNFGYDLVTGNGISSTDFSDVGINNSFMASVHCKPFNHFRIGASYYYDFIQKNFSGLHSGHTTAVHQTAAAAYKGNVRFELFSASVSYFANHLEILNEFCFNKSGTDTLGIASNYSNYIYAGYRLYHKFIPYVTYDFIDISNKDVHIGHLSKSKIIVGARYELSHQFNIKIHAAKISPNHVLIKGHNHIPGSESYEFKLQLAYGF